MLYYGTQMDDLENAMKEETREQKKQPPKKKKLKRGPRLAGKHTEL